MKFSEAYFLTLQKIYGLACAIQAEIRAFQPELLVVLARGGMAPLWALQALWAETGQESLPPLVVTNLGREKLLRYEHQRMANGVSHMAGFEPFDFYGDGERGYFLIWLAQQSDWRAELREQVKKTLDASRPPARILVIDDTVDKGYTTLIALGLLLAEFPQAETRMLAGDLPDWRQDLAAPWLVTQGARRSHPQERELLDCVFNLAHGASDLDPASLQWEPLHAGSRTMTEYGKFLLPETWLELPVWLQDQIAAFVRQSVRVPPQPPAGRKAEKIHRPVLEPVELEYRRRWLSGPLTPAEAAEELGMSLETAARLLQTLRNTPQ